MASGPVVAIVFEGLDAVKTGRAMLGATNPLASPIGTQLFILDHCNMRSTCVVMQVPFVVTSALPSVGTSFTVPTRLKVLRKKLICMSSASSSIAYLASSCLYSWFPEGVTPWTSVFEQWLYE